MGFEQYKKLFNKQNKLLLKEAKKPNPRVANKFNEMIKSGARAEKIFYDPRNIKWMKATRVKQVLPTVGRTIGAASGWGTLIAGASLLAQTKKAKKFREDPIHRKATIKKLFHTKNKFPIFTISPSVARFFEESGHKPSKKYPPKIRDPYWGKN